MYVCCSSCVVAVPKKVMFNAAGLAHALEDAKSYGFEVGCLVL